MSNCADGTRPATDEHLREAAAILAAGVLRLRERAALPAENDGKVSAKQPPVGLEVPAETRRSVLGG
jgi:hypothetical protein